MKVCMIHGLFVVPDDFNGDWVDAVKILNDGAIAFRDKPSAEISEAQCLPLRLTYPPIMRYIMEENMLLIAKAGGKFSGVFSPPFEIKESGEKVEEE